LRLYRWLRKRIKDEKQSILMVVVILYIIMIYEFYTGKLVDKLTFFLLVWSKAPLSVGQVAYIGMLVLAGLFFLWSSFIVVLCAVELTARVREKRTDNKQ
jgi:hypothetical protein